MISVFSTTLHHANDNENKAQHAQLNLHLIDAIAVSDDLIARSRDVIHQNNSK